MTKETPFGFPDAPEPAGIQFQTDEVPRGRGRTSKRTSGNISSGTTSRSLSRSRSRAESVARDEEMLRWTILQRDPSMRLAFFNSATNNNNMRRHSMSSSTVNLAAKKNESHNNNDDDNSSQTSNEYPFDDDDISDEEQVSDIETEADVEEDFQFELGNKVLPNYNIDINTVLESGKKWIRSYEADVKGHEKENIDLAVDDEGYARAIEGYTKGNGGNSKTGNNYILYSDLSSESTYCLAYLIGALVKNGDTIYILHHEGTNKKIPTKQLQDNVFRIKRHVLHLFDAASCVIDDIDAVIISLIHPYPKHFLTEMIHGLDPLLLIYSLKVVLSSLQNFISNVPTLVVRKKLKKTKKKTALDA